MLFFVPLQSSRETVRCMTIITLRSLTHCAFVANLSTMSLPSSYRVVSCHSSLSAVFFYSRTVTTVLDWVRPCLFFPYAGIMSCQPASRLQHWYWRYIELSVRDTGSWKWTGIIALLLQRIKHHFMNKEPRFSTMLGDNVQLWLYIKEDNNNNNNNMKNQQTLRLQYWK